WLATELAAAGASDEERTAIMGHTDIHTTSVYTHWRERRLAETLDAALPDLRDGQ
ncbi:integrase/recombinase, partial [Bifidobacterium bifidum IPLA 20015]